MKYKTIHMARAKNAPAVPGAKGMNPVPSPVDSTMCSQGASPKEWLLLLLIV